jgi:hypothetical protein
MKGRKEGRKKKEERKLNLTLLVASGACLDLGELGTSKY